MSSSSSNYFTEQDIATIKAIPLEDLLRELKVIHENVGTVAGPAVARKHMYNFLNNEAKGFLSYHMEGTTSAKKMPISDALGGDKVKRGKFFVHGLPNYGDWDDKEDFDNGEPLRIWFSNFLETWFKCVVCRWDIITGYTLPTTCSVSDGMIEVESMVRYCIATFPFQLEGNRLNNPNEEDGLGSKIKRMNNIKAISWELKGFNGNMFDASDNYDGAKFQTCASQIARQITVNGKPFNVLFTVNGGASNTLAIRGDPSVIKKYLNDPKKRNTIVNSCFVTYVAGSSSGSSKRKRSAEVEDVTVQMRKREKEANTIVLDGADADGAKKSKVNLHDKLSGLKKGDFVEYVLTIALCQYTTRRGRIISLLEDMAVIRNTENVTEYCYVKKRAQLKEGEYNIDDIVKCDPPATTTAATTTTTTTTTTPTAARSIKQGPQHINESTILTILRSGKYRSHWADMDSYYTAGGAVYVSIHDIPPINTRLDSNLTYMEVWQKTVNTFMESNCRETRTYKGLHGGKIDVSACVIDGKVFYGTLKFHYEGKIYFPLPCSGDMLLQWFSLQTQFFDMRDRHSVVLADPNVFFLLQRQEGIPVNHCYSMRQLNYRENDSWRLDNLTMAFPQVPTLSLGHHDYMQSLVLRAQTYIWESVSE